MNGKQLGYMVMLVGLEKKSPRIAEALALREVLIWLRNLSFNEVDIEIYAKDLVDTIMAH